MVTRWQSDELRREALAYEDLCAKPGLFGRCSCLAGTAIIVIGFLAPVLSLDRIVVIASGAFHLSAPAWAAPPPPEPQPEPEPTPPAHRLAYASPYAAFDGSPYGSGARNDVDHSRPYGEEVLSAALLDVRPLESPLGLDSSLTWVLGALASLACWACCASGGPGFPARRCRDRGAGDASTDAPPGGPRGAGLFGAFGGGGGGGSPQGAFGNVAFGSGPYVGMQGGPMPWAAAPPPGPGPGPSPDGFFVSPFSLRCWVEAAASWLGAGAQAFVSMPSEAEVADTYRQVPELQRWAASLLAFLEQQVVDPLLRELEASDQRLTQGLQDAGWRFTCDARWRGAPWLGGGGGGSAEPAGREVGVLDAQLPPQLQGSPGAVSAWSERQRLESFLHHPAFDRAASRGHVVARLREWRARGVQGSSTPRQGYGMPTDAHILENLLMRMLQSSVPEFWSCYVSSDGQAPPGAQARHGPGLAPVAWLRQVAPQRQRAKLLPYYELVTPERAWKLRPGNTNVLEALGLLLQVLRQRRPTAYQAFPENLRAALEMGHSGHAGHDYKRRY